MCQLKFLSCSPYLSFQKASGNYLVTSQAVCESHLGSVILKVGSVNALSVADFEHYYLF